IRQFEAGGYRQTKLGSSGGLRRLCAPGLIRHCACYCTLFLALRLLLFFLLGAGRVVNDLVSGNSVDDCASIRLEFFIRNSFQVSNRSAIVAFKVFGQIARVSQEMVVLIEAVGYASETAQALQPL